MGVKSNLEKMLRLLVLGLMLQQTNAQITADTSVRCQEYYAKTNSTSAKDWCDNGAYFDYTSKLNGGRKLQIFYHCSGEQQLPPILMGHGWPTSSYDFKGITELLDSDHFVCSLDYIGHGFSDKPADANYKYSMFEHADVLEKLVTEVVPRTHFTYLTHDESHCALLVDNESGGDGCS